MGAPEFLGDDFVGEPVSIHLALGLYTDNITWLKFVEGCLRSAAVLQQRLRARGALQWQHLVLEAVGISAEADVEWRRRFPLWQLGSCERLDSTCLQVGRQVRWLLERARCLNQT